jgi:hypothetical protein
MSVERAFLHRLPLNTVDISQKSLNIENKERSNPLSWNGQFSPQLVEVLLEKYAPDGALVLDPFAGSGTLLNEAAARNLGGIAADINPAACYLSSLHTLANKKHPSREKLMAQVENSLKQVFGSDLPLFGPPASYLPAEKLNRARHLLSLYDTSDALILLEALLIMSDFAKDGHDNKTVYLTWNKLRAVVRGLTYSSAPLRVINCDARKLAIPDVSVDLVVTSPPYINVFNYHQNYRSSAEALGWDLLSIAKSEIGSNRRNRGNRYLTVIQYCLDLAQVFGELSRVCVPGSRVIFVVGRESQVLGVPFYNGQLISSLATECVGYTLVTRQERVFRNRFGQRIYEDILHFVTPLQSSVPSLETAREIARLALKNCLKLASEDVLSDLNDAVERIADIQPSPIYNSGAARISMDLRTAQP